jgi:hypothetical protein
MVCRAYFGAQTERSRRPAMAVGNHLFSDTPISPGTCAADTDVGLIPRFSSNNVRGLSAYATRDRPEPGGDYAAFRNGRRAHRSAAA